MRREASRQSAWSILRVIRSELRCMWTASGGGQAKEGTTLLGIALEIGRKLAQRRESENRIPT